MRNYCLKISLKNIVALSYNPLSFTGLYSLIVRLSAWWFRKKKLHHRCDTCVFANSINNGGRMFGHIVSCPVESLYVQPTLLSVLTWSTFKLCRIPILEACSRSYLCNKQVTWSTCLYSLSHSDLNRVLEFYTVIHSRLCSRLIMRSLI